MENLTLIGTITIVHLIWLISPWPDLIMTIKNSLSYSRKTGIWTAVGFGLWMAIHISYCVAGLAILISKSILLFNLIKYLGAVYLIYIWIQSYRSRSSKITIEKQTIKNDISALSAVKIGFLTNILNPKVTLFFLSIFTFVITPSTPIYIITIVSIIMILNTIIWFSLVATLFTHSKIRTTFYKFQWTINKIFGWLLVAMWIKVALVE